MAQRRIVSLSTASPARARTRSASCGGSTASARRNKRNTYNALEFEVDAEARLAALRDELRAHTYRPGRSICFVTGRPKPREVFAADFRDRVVHHLLVSRQEPIFERRSIHDSYACRKGKGTLAASDRLMAFLRRDRRPRLRAPRELLVPAARAGPSPAP